MSRKDQELQKALNDIKNSMPDRDFEILKNAVLAKMRSGNLGDILQDNNLRATLQTLMQNKNIANLLQNPDLASQLSSILNAQGASHLMDQLQNLNGAEKKK